MKLPPEFNFQKRFRLNQFYYFLRITSPWLKKILKFDSLKRSRFDLILLFLEECVKCCFTIFYKVRKTPSLSYTILHLPPPFASLMPKKYASLMTCPPCSSRPVQFSLMRCIN